MYSRILIPVDGSVTAQRGLEEAIALGERVGAALHVLNVVDARLLVGHVSATVPPERLLDDWRAEGDRLVAAGVKLAQERGLRATGAVRCDPGLRVFELILQEAREREAELIVMGTHGRRGLRRLALGSDAEMVLRDSPVPVLLIRGHADDEGFTD